MMLCRYSGTSTSSPSSSLSSASHIYGAIALIFRPSRGIKVKKVNSYYKQLLKKFTGNQSSEAWVLSATRNVLCDRPVTGCYSPTVCRPRLMRLAGRLIPVYVTVLASQRPHPRVSRSCTADADQQ